MLDKEKEIAQWDSWLLSAVHKIRAQKQGTTLHRIYNAVRFLAEKEQVAEQTRKSPIAPIYKTPFETLRIVEFHRHLDRAVKNGLLLKITTKGYTVYKTPETCEPQRQLNLTNATATDTDLEYNNEKVTKCVLKVFRELTEADPNPKASTTSLQDSKNNHEGYTVTQISEYLRQSHIIQLPPNSPHSSCDTETVIKKPVEGILKQEIAKGNHVQLNNEHYRYSPGENVRKADCSKSTPVPVPVPVGSTGTGKRSGGDISRDNTEVSELKIDRRQRWASPLTCHCSFMSLAEAHYWCVVCGNLAKRARFTTKAQANMLNVLTFYFEKIMIDVKPKDIFKHRVCDACFEKLEELSDTHLAREKLKMRIRRDHRQLLKVSLRGLQKRKSDNLPFFGVHSKLQATHYY